jgi:hypothetical protein
MDSHYVINIDFIYKADLVFCLFLDCSRVLRYTDC